MCIYSTMAEYIFNEITAMVICYRAANANVSAAALFYHDIPHDHLNLNSLKRPRSGLPQTATDEATTTFILA